MTASAIISSAIKPYTGDYKWSDKASDIIGSGTFATVYRGYHSHEKFSVAIKCVIKNRILRNEKSKRIISREIDILSNAADCQHIVKLFTVEETDTEIIFVMELCDTDYSIYRKSYDPNEKIISRFLKQVSLGISFLHRNDIVHRDIKPQNVLLKWTDATNTEFDIKLADFGYARYWDQHIALKSLAGSPAFMAPEALECLFEPSNTYTYMVDMWSIGALLYFAIAGQYGFAADIKKILDYVSKKEDAMAFEVIGNSVHYIRKFPKEINQFFSAEFLAKIEELVKHLLDNNPLKRLDSEELVEFVETLDGTQNLIFFLFHSQFKLNIDKSTINNWEGLIQNIVELFAIAENNFLILYEFSNEFHSLSLLKHVDYSHFLSCLHFLDIVYLFDTSVLRNTRPVPLVIPTCLSQLENLSALTKDNLILCCNKLIKAEQATRKYVSYGFKLFFRYCNIATTTYQQIETQLLLEKASADAKIDTLHQTLQIDHSNLHDLFMQYPSEHEQYEQLASEIADLQSKHSADISFQLKSAHSLCSNLNSTTYYIQDENGSLNAFRSTLDLLIAYSNSKMNPTLLNEVEVALSNLNSERLEIALRVHTLLSDAYNTLTQLNLISTSFSNITTTIRCQDSLLIQNVLLCSRQIVSSLALSNTGHIESYIALRTPSPGLLSCDSLQDELDDRKPIECMISTENFKIGDTILLIPHRIKYFRSKYVPIVANTEDIIIFLTKSCYSRFKRNFKQGNFKVVCFAKISKDIEIIYSKKQQLFQVEALPTDIPTPPN